jgi:hypothetical protein
MCESFPLKRERGKVSVSIGIRITMISCIVYLLLIFKMFNGVMNNPVYSIRYYPLFQVTAVGLGTYYTRIRGALLYTVFTTTDSNMTQLQECVRRSCKIGN